MRNVLLFVFLFANFCATAQFVTASPSSTLFKPVSYLSLPDGGFIGIKKVLKDQKGNYSIQYNYQASIVRYNKHMDVIKEQSLFGGENNVFIYLELKKLGDKYWIVYCDPLKKNRFSNFRAMEIDPESLQTSVPKMLADESKIDESTNFFEVDEERNVNFKSSLHQRYSALLIDNGLNEFFLMCLDEKLDPVWSKKQKIPAFKQEDMSSMAVDDEGNIYLSYAKKEKVSVAVFNQKGEISQKSLDFGAAIPTEIKLLTNKEGQLLAAGPYKENSDQCNGVYRAVLNKKSFAVEKMQKTVFPEPLIGRLKKDGFAKLKAGDYGINPYAVYTKVIEDEENNLRMILELKSILGNNKTLAEGSLVFVNLTPSIAVFSHIPRYALTPDISKGPHYYTSTCQNKLVLFYKDHIANLTIDLSKDQKVLNGEGNAIIVMATIGQDGSIKRKAFYGSGGLTMSESVNKASKEVCNLQ